jgi:hypothetical protein
VIENFLKSQHRLKMLNLYCDQVRERKYVQEFVWEDESVYENEEERKKNELNCRPETLDPKWRKTIKDRLIRQGFVYKSLEGGFSIECP